MQQKIIEELDLSPHPEGGFYKEVYRSEQKVSLSGDGSRSAGTSIYFMLTEGQLSDWHRVRWEELWHFYQGDTLILEYINEKGQFRTMRLGSNLSTDEEFQRLIPRNCWQRAYSTGQYSLVGCTVSPGFEFKDFEMIEAEKLAENYPGLADQIVTMPFS